MYRLDVDLVSRKMIMLHVTNKGTDQAPEVIKLFFILNSTEHEISTAHKNLNTVK